VPQKKVLLVDDDQWFLEPLVDALDYEGYRVLTARTVSDALSILAKEPVDLVTVDIMLDPGEDLKDRVASHSAGVYLCEELKKRFPQLEVICMSVVSDPQTIAPIRNLGIRIINKGETSLRSVLNMLKSRLTGITYSTDDV